MYHSSTAIGCKHCLTTTHTTKKGETSTHYYHSIVSATMIKARSHKILPIDLEAITNSDGTLKQDCELNAAKRLLARLRQELPLLAMLIVGDAI
jgi:hypothetical protein